MRRCSRIVWVIASVAFLLPAGVAHALWEQHGVALCTAAGDQTRAVVVADGQGGAFVVWDDARSGDRQVYAQRVNALGVPQWLQPQGIMVSSGTYPQRDPVAVGDGAGGVIIAWILDLGGTTVQGQRLNGGGSPVWTPGGIPLIPGAANPVELCMISDGRQPVIQTPGVILAWTDDRFWPATDVYAQAVDASGAPRWGADGVAVCTAAGNQTDLAMVTDGSGATLTQPRGAILAWSDTRAAPTNSDVYSQRLNSGGVPQWTPDGVPVSVLATGVQGPVIVPAGSGAAIVAWPDARTGRSYDLYAQRVATSGGWVTNGVPVAPPYEGQTAPAAVGDGAGGIVVTWSGFGGVLNRDVFAQRLDAAGAPVWAPAGMPVCTTSGSQNNPVIVRGRNGGSIIAWVDSRFGDADVFVQQLDAAGASLWNPAGIPICTASGFQTELAAAQDTTGGAIVAWTDRRGADADIYVQQVTGGGGVVAAEPGRPAGVRLLAPKPNPSSGGVTIRFDLPVSCEVDVEVFDVSGKRVRTLLAPRSLAAGSHVVAWDTVGDGQVRVPPGVYWVAVRAGGERLTRRAVILR